MARLVLAAALTAALLHPSSARAQAVRGRAVEAATERPLPGAIASLLDTADRRVVTTIVGADGVYLLVAPAPGDYRLRIDVIGYATWRSASLALGARDTTALDARVELKRVELDPVVISGESRCDTRPQDAPRTLALWEEVRRALTVSDLTSERRLLPLDLLVRDRYTALRYERGRAPFAVAGEQRTAVVRGAAGSLPPGSMRPTPPPRLPTTAPQRPRVLFEQTQHVRGGGIRPWGAPPAADIALRGFVQQDGDTLSYFGPDVPILLSEEFLGTHCFRPVRRGLLRTSGIGLAFAPAAGRVIPDVEGTIWLDAESSELREIEFGFVNLTDGDSKRAQPGGTLTFARQPSGLWYVQRWALRLPIVDAKSGRTVVAMRERTGEATPLDATRGGVALTVAGALIDSTVGAGLVGAVVSLPGAAPTTTDSLGGCSACD